MNYLGTARPHFSRNAFVAAGQPVTTVTFKTLSGKRYRWFKGDKTGIIKRGQLKSFRMSKENEGRKPLAPLPQWRPSAPRPLAGMRSVLAAPVPLKTGWWKEGGKLTCPHCFWDQVPLGDNYQNCIKCHVDFQHPAPFITYAWNGDRRVDCPTCFAPVLIEQSQSQICSHCKVPMQVKYMRDD